MNKSGRDEDDHELNKPEFYAEIDELERNAASNTPPGVICSEMEQDENGI